MGRFVNRDPIGYEGSDGNLLCYVKSNPVGFTDPSGLEGEGNCDDPCGDYFAAGKVAKDLAGGVVCCGGKKYSCAWKASTNEPTADKLIADCIRQHEDTHHDDVEDCRKCQEIYQPPFKDKTPKFQNEQECEAYKKQLECVRKAYKEGCKTPRCKYQLGLEMDRVSKRLSDVCGKKE